MRLGEGIVTFAQHSADLDVEIGVMLGQRPDRDDQMVRRHGGNAAFGLPTRDDGGLFIDEVLEIATERFHHPWRALQDLVGKETAFAGIVAAEVKFAADIGEDFRDWVAACIQIAQRVEPVGQEPAKKFDMDRFLGGKIVEQVRLAHPRRLGDLVERLVESGHLDRRTSETDRRVQVIRLTKSGRAEFRKMAAEHQGWISDMFGDLSPRDVRELMRLLGKTKGSVQKSARRRSGEAR